MKKILLLIFVFLVGCSAIYSNDENKATFVRVVDGDTLIANIDGKEEYVRLLLVDTPETKHSKKEIQPFGSEASELMRIMFQEGDSIRLEYGTEKRDNYDRILAYIYTEDGRMFNKELLKRGLARVAYVFPPNDKYAKTFQEIEGQAKKKKIGVWSIDGYVTNRGFNSDAVELLQ